MAEETVMARDWRLARYNKSCADVGEFLRRHRKNCWESEFQGGEYAVGERAVSSFVKELAWEASRDHSWTREALMKANRENSDLETRLTIAVKALERSRLFVESLESVPILDQEDRDGLKFHARNAKAEIDRAFTEIRGIDRALDREEGK